MGGMAAGGDQAVASGQEVEGAPGVEGIGRVAGGYPLASGPPWECCQEAGTFSQPHATCNPEGRSLLRTPVQTLTEITPKTMDWSHPIEVDDSLPQSVAPETADWSQLQRGTLGACQYWTCK